MPRSGSTTYRVLSNPERTKHEHSQASCPGNPSCPFPRPLWLIWIFTILIVIVIVILILIMAMVVCRCSEPPKMPLWSSVPFNHLQQRRHQQQHQRLPKLLAAAGPRALEPIRALSSASSIPTAKDPPRASRKSRKRSLAVTTTRNRNHRSKASSRIAPTTSSPSIPTRAPPGTMSRSNTAPSRSSWTTLPCTMTFFRPRPRHCPSSVRSSMTLFCTACPRGEACGARGIGSGWPGSTERPPTTTGTAPPSACCFTSVSLECDVM
mmetsp:Transcript_8701/g.25816  ORF Transcript_8701/g.25816 Transcript_8701/m.25816 type:complete len:265 (+) Transcript_8701:945-1739(+)